MATAINNLGNPVKPAPRSSTWMKSGPSSIQAHRIMSAGSKFFVTACDVALLRSTAVGATSATLRCFECTEKDKPLFQPVDNSQGKGRNNTRPRTEPAPLTEKGQALRAAYDERKVKA